MGLRLSEYDLETVDPVADEFLRYEVSKDGAALGAVIRNDGRWFACDETVKNLVEVEYLADACDLLAGLAE